MVTESASQYTAVQNTVKITYTQDDADIIRVIVYADRAQVTRRVKLPIQSIGKQIEFALDGISNQCESESIRVEVEHGLAVLDVSYKSIRTKKETQQVVPDSKQETIRSNKLASINEDIKVLRKEIELLNSEWGLISGFSDTLLNKSARESVMNDGAIEYFDTYWGYQRSEGRIISEKIFKLNEEINDKQKEQRNLRLQGVKPAEEFIVKTRINVLFEAIDDDDEEGKGKELEINEYTAYITYVIRNASWSPRYDIRVNSDTRKLELHYQAEIKQHTDELWNKVDLALSTAQPALGGQVPTFELPWKINIYRPPVVKEVPVLRSVQKSRRRLSNISEEIERPSGSTQMRTLSSAVVTDKFSKLDMLNEEEEINVDSKPAIAVAAAQQGVTGMMFNVQTKSTIPSDNSPHKVTVMIVELVPEFHYITVPKMSAHAFLKTSVKNTTEFALLSGPANVFLDNNFVAKSTLKDVSPQETFECSLGIDSSVRITYPPHTKQQSSSGLISRINTISIRQEIKVKNGRSTGIKIRILDQFPISEIERIKIEHKSPINMLKIERKPGEVEEGSELVVTGSKEPRLYTDKNTVEWVITVDGTKESSVAFAYEVTSPYGESIMGL